MTRADIRISGCDDSQTLTGDFTDSEMALLAAVAVASKIRGGGCVPTVSVSVTSSTGRSHDCYCDDDEPCTCTTVVDAR